MLQPLNGPSKSSKLSSVTASTAVEVKAGASAFDDRQIVTMQSTSEDTNSGAFWVYFADEGETPSAATVSANGFYHPEDSVRSYEAARTQAIWVVSVTGTVDIRFSERG